MELIEILLPAIGIGTIAAAIIGYLGTHRKNQIDGITAERTRWREELRRISDELYVAPLEDSGRYLQQLELHINGYGISHKTDYMLDGHIWKLISEMQENIDDLNSNMLIHNKKILNKCISLLLKHDWERSKIEVKGEPFNLLMWIVLFCFSTVDIFLLREWFFDSNLYVHSLLNVFSYFLLSFLLYWYTQLFSDSSNLSKKYLWGKIISVLLSFSIVAVVIVWVSLSIGFATPQDLYFEEIWTHTVVLSFFIKILLGIVLTPLWIIVVARKRKVNQDYYQEISMLINMNNENIF